MSLHSVPPDRIRGRRRSAARKRPGPVRRRRPASPVLPPAPPAGPTPGTPAGTAFEGTVAALHARLSVNVRAFLETGGAETVHGLRVAERRLRAALDAYRKFPRKPEAKRLKGELKWLHGRFGPVRDLDVFRAEALAPLIARHKGGAEASALAALAAQVDAARAAAVKKAVQAAGTARYARLAGMVARWAAGNWPRRSKAPATVPVEEIGAKSLARAHGRVRRAIKDAKGEPGDAQHEVRIEIKKLRYAAQFFAPAFPRPRTEAYLRRLARLQDALGVLQDTEAATALARRLARRGGGRLRLAAKLVAEAEARRRGKAMKHIARLTSAFLAAKPFWT